MNITAAQISYKRQVGKHESDPVWEIATKGGLHLIVANRKSGSEVLGVGSHRAVARHIANKKAPGMVLNELSKSDHVPVEFFAHLLPRYEAETEYLREKAGFEP